MGNILSIFLPTKKFLILGPERSGKTKIFTEISLSLKILPKMSPKAKFNFLKYKNYNIWDLSGNNQFIDFWSCYYDNAVGIIYIYDIENDEKSEKILKDLLYCKELRSATLLIIINKLKNIEETKDYKDKISKLLKRRNFNIISNDSNFSEIAQGFEWLIKTTATFKKVMI